MRHYIKSTILTLFCLMMLNSCSSPSEILSAQFLPVKGIVNARDLGGYATTSGQTVRDSLLFRTASLAEATDEDLALLEGIPVKEVIDFRMDLELKGKEDRPVPGARYLRLPVNASKNSMDAPEAKKIKEHKKFDVNKIILAVAFNEKAQALARDLYPNMVLSEDCQKQFGAFLQEVAHAREGAVLFHCTQGKDRTGLASAFILSALGVDRETVVADFDATNAAYAKDVKKISRRVRLMGGGEEEEAVVKAFIGANTDNFIRTLDLIDEKWGSMHNYLTGPLGLSEDDIEQMKARYLK